MRGALSVEKKVYHKVRSWSGAVCCTQGYIRRGLSSGQVPLHPSASQAYNLLLPSQPTSTQYLPPHLFQRNTSFSIPSLGTMPSNTSHIQKRDELNSHPDLVLFPTEWQEEGSHGFHPDFDMRPAPVSERSVSIPLCPPKHLTAKQGTGPSLQELQSNRHSRKEMSQMQDPELAIQARYSSTWD